MSNQASKKKTASDSGTSTSASSTSSKGEPVRIAAEVVREYRPMGTEASIHGVTFDGRLVWFARDNELVAFDPDQEKVTHRYDIANANAGTAYDGENLYQIAKEEILVINPKTGDVVRRFPAPGQGGASGLAYADGYLWVGQYRATKIHKVDAKTGEVVKTLLSDRFVTGVSCVDGALWHGAVAEDKPCELRRLDSVDGTVQETLEVPVRELHGVERTRSGDFWCAGEKGTLRRVRAVSPERSAR